MSISSGGRFGRGGGNCCRAVGGPLAPLRSLLHSWDLAFFLCCCLKLAGTFGAEVICRNTPNLTATQLDMCLTVPRALVVLSDVMATFEDECSWQFKTSRWNCSGVQAPVYVNTGLEDSPESAFVQALTSAITVYKITEACHDNELGNYCGRSNTQQTTEGHSVLSPYNITAGRLFAQQFLDNRPLLVQNDGDSSLGDKIRAQIEIHNNGVGRHVANDNRRTKCICSGVSGSCTVKTCTTYMPSVFEIGDILKVKHEEALKVVPVVDGNGAVSLRLEHRTREGEGDPTSTELIYIATPTNQCESDPEYTTSRFCLPQANLTSDPSLRQFYPPCEEFCCSGRYRSTTKTVPQSCNCYFQFCCDLTCEMCQETFTEYECIGATDRAGETPSQDP